MKDGKRHRSLTFLIKRFIYEKRFSTDLTQAFVTALYKKGTPDNRENYRPISVTGALSKLFERCLYNQIEEYMLNEKLYNDLQFGFRKIISTTEALIYCTENIRKEINDKKFDSTACFGSLQSF